QTTSENPVLRRHSALAGAGLRMTDKLSLNLDSEITRSDRVIFRTSLTDYERIRLRGRYQVATGFELYGSFQYLNNSNPAGFDRYEFKSQQSALGLHWTPRGGKTMQVIGEYGRSAVRSDLTYLTPQLLSPQRSLYVENAHTVTGM